MIQAFSWTLTAPLYDVSFSAYVGTVGGAASQSLHWTLSHKVGASAPLAILQGSVDPPSFTTSMDIVPFELFATPDLQPGTYYVTLSTLASETYRWAQTSSYTRDSIVSSVGQFALAGVTPADLGTSYRQNLVSVTNSQFAVDITGSKCPQTGCLFCLDSNTCLTCDAGFYKTGVNACTPCPAGSWSSNVGATSASTCKHCPEGAKSALTGQTSAVAACAVSTCSAGYFLKPNTYVCRKWRECIDGISFEISPPTTTSDRRCQYLHVCRVRFEYQSVRATYTTDRVCTDLTECDGITKYESTAPTLTSNRLCSDITTCVPNTSYQSVHPTKTSNRMCLPLTTCTATEYASLLPTLSSNRVCSTATTCKVTEYEYRPLTATSDRHCRVIRLCHYPLTYQSQAPTASTNRKCAATRLPCRYDTEYESTAITLTNDRVCSSLAKCPLPDYQSIPPTKTSNRICCSDAPDFTGMFAATTSNSVSQYRSVTGTVLYDGTPMTPYGNVVSNCLQYVGSQASHSLIVTGASFIQIVSFPSLTQVSGRFSVNILPQLVSVSLPVLTSVARFEIFTNPNLTFVSAPLLAYVTDSSLIGNPLGTGFSIQANNDVRIVRLDRLAFVAGRAQVSDTSALSTLALPVLTLVGDLLRIENHQQLTFVNLAALTRVSGAVKIATISSHVSFWMPELASIGTINSNAGDQEFYLNITNVVLTTLYLPLLTSVPGTVVIGENFGLLDISFLALTYIGGDCLFSSNVARSQLPLIGVPFGRFDLNQLIKIGTSTVIGRFVLEFNDIAIIDLSSLASVSSSFRVESNLFLKEFTAPVLTSVGLGLTIISNNKLQSIKLGVLTSITDSIQIADNFELDHVDLTSLTFVSGSLTIFDCSAFSPPTQINTHALLLGNLLSVGNAIDIHSVGAFTTLDLIQLTSVGSFFSIITTSFADLNFRDLKTVGYGNILDAQERGINIITNAYLTVISMESLLRVNESITIRGNLELKTVALASLTLVARDFQIAGNHKLATVHFPDVAHVAKDFYVSYNYALERLIMPSLTFVGGNVDIRFNHQALTSVELSGLTYIGGHLNVESNFPLQTLSFSSLTYIGGDNGGGESISITYQPSLATLTFGTLTHISAPGGSLAFCGLSSTFVVPGAVTSLWSNQLCDTTTDCSGTFGPCM